MWIQIDTREQQPLKFRKCWPNMTGTERVTVDVGDYAVRFKDGYIPPVRVERKSISDLYGTLSSGMVRFKNEINKAIAKNYRLYLFVEEPPSKLKEYIADNPQFRKSYDTLYDTWSTLEVKHGVIVKFFENKREMAYAVYKLFFALGKYHVKGLKEAKRKAKLR